MEAKKNFGLEPNISFLVNSQDCIEEQMERFLGDPKMQERVDQILLNQPGIYSRARLTKLAIKQEWTRNSSVWVESGAFLGSIEGFEMKRAIKTYDGVAEVRVIVII